MAARQPTKGHISPPEAAGTREELDGVLEPPRRLFAPLPDVDGEAPEVERLRAQVEELGVLAERLRARALASQREAVLLSEHLTTRGALLGALRAESAMLRRDLERAHDERDIVGRQHDALGRDLETTRTTLAARDAETATMRAEAATLRAEVEEQVGVAEALAGEADDLRSQLETVQRSGAQLTAQVATLTTDLERAREVSASLRTELAAALDDITWHVGETRRAQDAAQDATRRAEAAIAMAAVVSDPVTAVPTAVEPGQAPEMAEALERARIEVRDSADLLASAEQSRDLYAMYLRSVATTGPGRIARRWARFSQANPRAARIIRAPFTGTWRLLTLRWPGWLRQHPLFDRDWYVEVNRDVQGNRMRPWWHYVRHGIREGRAPNRYFDRAWYLRTYPDVQLSGMDPLEHYHRFGGWEGRDPSPRFASAWYLAQHPDVMAAGVNPLRHFLGWGLQEGYQPRPMSAAKRRAVSASRSALTPALTATAGWLDAQEPTRPSSAAPAAAPVVTVDAGRVKRALRSALPDGARVGVVSDGNRELLAIAGLEVVPVPRAADGRPASDVQRNELSAIAHVESLRVAHLDYLAAPEPSLWMTIVPGLQRYLDGRYATVGRRTDGAAIHDLRAPAPRGASHDGEDIRTLLRRARERLGREPSILDWDSGAGLSADATGLSVFSPATEATGRSLPYADASIDVVLIPESDPLRIEEARRIASSLVLGVRPGARGAAARVEWLDGADENTGTSVSIVIPTYDDVTLIATCLRTLDETIEGRRVEIIVSDDGSASEYHDRLDSLAARYERVRVVRSATNGGYIAAVNAGAATAVNDLLVFLNNDTILLPGWLEPLVETLRDRPRTGVVGGMLLYPDGRLQEAGCAIFRDGSATKIGFSDSDPTLAYYAHPRTVDYVSGALLATPRAIFERLGGLDPAFGFGYYEDGDYCFRARREGLDVVYQPRSVVVHVEGGTAGTDLTKGAKRFQATNQALFVDRWRSELERQPVRPEPMDIHASRDLVIRGRTGSTTS